MIPLWHKCILNISWSSTDDCRVWVLWLELYLAIWLIFRTAREATYQFMISLHSRSRHACVNILIAFLVFVIVYGLRLIFPLWLIFRQEPVVDSLKSAVDRLTHSTNFLEFLGQHALIMHDELPSVVEEHIDNQRYHFMSLILNLANTFLYMVNTYIIVPTADDYSTSLGAAPTVCGIVIGAMAVAQIFSSVYFSAWSNKSYFRPLVFSSIVLLIGNAMYALAYDSKSLTLLLLGRVFCG